VAGRDCRTLKELAQAVAAAVLNPQMIALSITCRMCDAFVQEERHQLSALIDGRCPLVVGGQASEHYQLFIEAAGGTVCLKNEEFLSLFH
jgi:hypothetical protein